MSRGIGFAVMVLVFATLLPDIFSALKIIILKFLGLTSVVLDGLASAGVNLHL